MSNVKIEHEIQNNVAVCHIQGRLDVEGAAVMEPYVELRISSGEKRLVLDLGRVDYISSAGLRCLLVVAKKLQSANGCLALCHLTPAVLTVLSASGFQQLLEVCTTQAEAVAALARAPE